MIAFIITEDFFEDIADDVTKWFDKSNYDENDKSSFKDELGGKIMKESVALQAKTYP